MIRLNDEVYKKLIIKKAEFMNKYGFNYTLSDTIEICMLEANMYEDQQK